MSTGVGFPSYIDGATVAIVSGAAAPNYPVTNLADIFESRRPFRSAAAVAQSITVVLAALSAVQLIALCRHTLPAGSTMRVRLFVDANPDPVGNAGAIVYDSGVIAVWPTGGPVTTSSPSRPLLLSEPVLARSAYITVTPASGIVEIGALEIAGYWEWPGISPGYEFGVEQDDAALQLVGGAMSPNENAQTPRIANGQIMYLALGAAVNTALDFQKWAGKTRPFLFIEDTTSPASWARRCFLATNNDVMPLVGVLTRHDTFTFRFLEHLR